MPQKTAANTNDGNVSEMFAVKKSVFLYLGYFILIGLHDPNQLLHTYSF